MTPDDPQAWQTQSTQQVFANRWLAIYLDNVLLPTGQRYEYTRVAPGGVGVAVLGFNHAGEVLLEREYRHGVGEVIWQLPGGLAAAYEDLQAAGLRELVEETGYASSVVDEAHVHYLGVVWDNPALGPMCSHIYAAYGLEIASNTRRDPAEFVTPHWVSVPWLKEAVCSGEIKDRVVVAALAYWLLKNERSPHYPEV